MKIFLQKGGIRYYQRQAPLWMIINLFNNRCWCGKPHSQFDQFQRKYCTAKHSTWWTWTFNCYWDSFRMMIYRMQKFTCQECGFKIKRTENSVSKCDWEIDHIKAIKLGGMCFDTENVQLLCKNCHKKKTGIDIKKITLEKKHQTVLFPL